MDTVFFWFRCINIAMACLGFYTVAYKGVRVYIQQREQYNWAVFFLGFWFFLTAYGTGEQLYMETKPGPRAVGTFVLVACSLIYVMKLRAPYARKP